MTEQKRVVKRFFGGINVTLYFSFWEQGDPTGLCPWTLKNSARRKISHKYVSRNSAERNTASRNLSRISQASQTY